MSTNSDVLQSFLEVGVPRNDFKTLLQIVSAEVRERINQHDEQVQTFSQLVGDAPELLNTLGEISDAIADDPQFFATLASQVSELNTDVTATVTAMGIAENDTSMGTFSESVLPDDVNLKAVLEAFAVAWRTAKENIEAAASTIETNLATEIADRIAAITAEEQRVDALIASGMWLFADQASFPSAADNHGRVVHSHADGAIFYAHAGAWHQVAKEVDLQTTIQSVTNEATARVAGDDALSTRLDTLEADPITATDAASADATVLATANTYTDTSITNLVNGADAALDTLKEIGDALQQGDDDVTTALTNQITTEATTRGNADTALSNRLDVLEADPTTQTLLDAEATTRGNADTALSNRLDVLEADPTTQSAVDLKADLAGATFTGSVTVPTLDVNTTITTPDIRVDAGGDNATLTFVLETDGGADAGGLVWTRSTGGADIGAIAYHRSLDAIRFYTNGNTNYDVEIGSGGELNAQNGLAIGGTSITATAAELNFVDGVTSNIQTQLDAIQSDVDQNESDADTAIGLKLDASAVSAFGLTLVDDADAATARATLGLDASTVRTILGITENNGDPADGRGMYYDTGASKYLLSS